MFVIRHKAIFFLISGALVVASLVMLAVWGLNPGVDFSGGSIVQVGYSTSTRPSVDTVKAMVEEAGFNDVTVRESGDSSLTIRTQMLVDANRTTLTNLLTGTSTTGTTTAVTGVIERLSSVGPTVGEELRRKTLIAISLVILIIILYVAFVFRKVSKPISSWMYGLVAILTLLHDIIIPTGAFVLLGHLNGLEADTLFVVALLTILGVSVSDTIVVFDRIRENLRLNGESRVKEPFDETVGKSLQQTYVRSFNTSFSIILVLLILFFLGGPTIHSFMLTLLVGQIAGTYSSIFIASPLLVVIANRKLEKEARH
ncbi:MAG: protein translocase subunit SecF [Candidatus Campbellbacteria bacterium]|nr:protein translocase subunit SecF [Candidatus Campbellbacteria bacterium]